MQLDAVNDLLNEWIHKLNLDHWEISLTVDEELDDADNAAEVHISVPYNEAEIKLQPSYAEWDRAKTTKIILHELMHLHIDSIKTAAESCRSSLSLDTWCLYTWHLNHEIERAVEALAVATYRQTLGE